MGIDILVGDIDVNHINGFYGANMTAEEISNVEKTARGMTSAIEAEGLGVDYSTLYKMKLVEVYQQVTKDVD